MGVPLERLGGPSRRFDPRRRRGARDDGRPPDAGLVLRPHFGAAGHGEAHQTCLAHLARDVAFVDETSEDMLPSRLRLWLKRAFALADGIETFAASTITAKRRALERSLVDILAAPTACDLARDLQMKFRRARDQLDTSKNLPIAAIS